LFGSVEPLLRFRFVTLRVVDRSQATSFLFKFTEDTPNRDRFKTHLVPAVFLRFQN
jgi:hypothetical protein